MDDFRGVSLLSVVYKAMCMILQERLMTFCERQKLITEEQVGFKRGRGCRDQVLSLSLLGQVRMAYIKKGMMGAFVDFSKAYDRVDRHKLWRVLEAGGVTGRTLTFLEATYESISCEVRTGKELSEPFEVLRGLRQGCVLSPLLFSLYINSLVEKLRSREVGVRCRGKLIPGLLYVDDMILLAENEEMLKDGLNVLEEWCRQWGVKVNVPKCAIMHFRRKGVTRARGVFKIEGEEIQLVTSYKYLGCVIDEYLQMKGMVEVRAKAGYKALGLWMSRCRQNAGGIKGGLLGD